MTDHRDDTDGTLSPTAALIEALQLHGHAPAPGEPDHRPLPDERQAAGAVADIVDAFVATLQDTRLEPDLDDLLWQTVNLFHRATLRLERLLDGNEADQRRAREDQDGSEIRSVDLERLLTDGAALIDRRDTLELMRDHAADHYERHTGTIWRPRTGSKVNHRQLTAAMIDSRDFLAARKRAERDLLLPKGPRIAFTGGDCDDHRLIFMKLDQVHAKHPDMVLLHGGTTKGAERVAAKWAHIRKVPEIAFKPDWPRHGKAAPFKRNDLMLATLPIGHLEEPPQITASVIP